MLNKAVQRSERRQMSNVSEEALLAVLRFTFYALPFTVPESDARTLHGKRRVSARRGLAGEKGDFFSILLEVRIAISLAGDGSEGFLIHSICVQCRPVSSRKCI